MNEQAHFDRRSATYDRGSVHPKVASLLVQGVEIEPGFRVLDIATGTGLVALEVAEQVGPSGHVTGVDISEGMLREARRKAERAGLHHVHFVRADAETLELPRERFDCLFCASALVLMKDISGALRHWSGLLKPGGHIAFDTPAKPFGLLQRVAASAAAHGVPLAFDTVADTREKSRSLLSKAGFEAIEVRTERVSSARSTLDEALALWDSHLDHPALKALYTALPAVRETIRADYLANITAAAVGGYVPNDVALNLSFARKPRALG